MTKGRQKDDLLFMGLDIKRSDEMKPRFISILNSLYRMEPFF
jgi:hypothetical protein